MDILAQRFLPGYESLSPFGAVELAAGDTHILVQQTSAGMCYAVAALNNQGVDLDIRLYIEGELRAEDTRLDTYPIVEWCARSNTSVRIEIRAFDGDARVQYGVFRDRDSYHAAGGPLDELSNRVNAAVARAAPRWEAVGTQWRTAFERPDIRPMTVVAEPGFCYAVVAVGQASVTDIDLLLLDEQEQERARDFALDATPLVAYCPPQGETLTVQIALRSGRGVVAAQLLKHAR